MVLIDIKEVIMLSTTPNVSKGDRIQAFSNHGKWIKYGKVYRVTKVKSESTECRDSNHCPGSGQKVYVSTAYHRTTAVCRVHFDKVKDCPKCGGHLVKRNGSRGKFYGCSEYPNCRHTENI